MKVDLSKVVLIIMGIVGAWSLYAINSLHYLTFKYEIEFSDLKKFLEGFPSWFNYLAISSHNTFESSASRQEKMNAAQFARFILLLLYLGLSYFLIADITKFSSFVIFFIVLCILILGLIVGWRFGHSLIKKKTESSD